MPQGVESPANDPSSEQDSATKTDVENTSEMAEGSTTQTSAPPTRQKDGQPLEPLPEVSHGLLTPRSDYNVYAVTLFGIKIYRSMRMIREQK